MTDSVRPTKRQRQLLEFIEGFIGEHGYSPSYREIMTGCNYTSVATVALHVGGLISRGHLRKRDRSARSLELVHVITPEKIKSNEIAPTDERWLVEKVEYFFQKAEQMKPVLPAVVDELFVLVGALKILGLPGAAQSFAPRLSELKKHQTGNEAV